MARVLEDARKFGMDAESLANLREALTTRTAQDTDDGVWPENAEIVRAFCAVGSQWRTATIGGGFAPAMLMFIGLDYSAVRAGLEAEDFFITPELWSGIRIMESAACAALNEGNG